jgi:hypothetical protein
LQDIGDSVRKEYRNQAYLAKSILPLIKKDKNKNIVIDSFKNPAEIQIFKHYFDNFILFAIDASTENRWERLKDLYEAKKKYFITLI